MNTWKIKVIGILAIVTVLAGCASAQQAGGDGSTPATAAQLEKDGGGAPTWTLVLQREIPHYIESVAYGNGKFVAGGRINGGGGEIVYSTDGITWTMVTDNAAGKQANNNITFCGGRFFATGWPNNMVSSTDGENWTTVVSNLRDGIRGPTYGNGKWIIATYGGLIMYSTDGVTWTETKNRPSGFQYNTVAYGNGKFVAGAMGGKMAHSTDGITWTAVTDTALTRPTNNSLDIVYIDGKFFANGSRHLAYSLAYSIDGVTWATIEQSIFEGYDIHTIVYGGGMFITADYRVRMLYSTDGITWAAFEPGVFGGNRSADIAYGNGRFVMVGSYGEVDWDRIKESTEGRIAYLNMQE